MLRTQGFYLVLRLMMLTDGMGLYTEERGKGRPLGQREGKKASDRPRKKSTAHDMGGMLGPCDEAGTTQGSGGRASELSMSNAGNQWRPMRSRNHPPGLTQGVTGDPDKRSSGGWRRANTSEWV